MRNEKKVLLCFQTILQKLYICLIENDKSVHLFTMKLLRSICYLSLLLAGILFLQSCGGEDPFSIDYSQVPPPFKISEAVRDSVLPQGVKIYVIEEGDGLFQVTFKDRIVVKYTGRTASGEIFVSSYSRRSDNDTNFKATLVNLYPYPIQTPRSPRPVPPLIEGFRKGLYGMQPGEKRIIVVPPEMGSNRQTRSGIDLDGKTLVYNVELVEIVGTARQEV